MAIRNAQLDKAVVYYFSNPNQLDRTGQQGTGEIIMGLPEQYAAPEGFEKVVCRSVMEAERWSKRMRIWEEAKEKIAQAYQRHKEAEQVEGIRSQMRANIANARNQVNRDFAIRVLENFDKRYEDKFQWERESYLHSEAYESGNREVKQPRYKKMFVGKNERSDMEG